jgi:hypothetical protein
VSTPEPIFVPADAKRMTAECDDCVAEKNRGVNGRGWSPGEDHSDIQFEVELPLDQDRAWVKCRYGHDHLAVRSGTEAAERFL